MNVAHVDHVLTAEFDLDAGPLVRHQYPEIIRGDRQLMAELMLPDQIHDRTEDWTIFFLYKRKGSDQLEYYIDDEQDKEESQKVYVLNLVNTKFDSSLKRGAQVKAMAIVTRHPFFHVFKPLLVLALDDYFKSGTDTPLIHLYNSLNAMDLSQVPQFSVSEKLLLASSEHTSLFIEKFDDTETGPSSRNNGNDSPTFYIDLRNNYQRMVSRHASLVRDTHVFETSVQYRGMKIPIKVPTDYSRESVGDFSLVRLVTLLTSMKGNVFQHQHPELTPYGAATPPLLVLIFALLTQKRVLFVGVNTPSGEVADQVLACCSLASGGGSVLRSFTASAFPYTDLSKVDDLLASRGYIAGVKNPAFERHNAWWDVLVDIESKTMRISAEVSNNGSGLSNIARSTTTGTHSSSLLSSANSAPSAIQANGQVYAEDFAFVDELHKMVTNHYGETSVRRMCKEYIRRFVRMAINYEEVKYGATNLWPSCHDPAYNVVPGYGYTWVSESHKMADLAVYAPVIEGWRASRSYKYYIGDQREIWDRPPKSVVDFEYLIDRLRLQQLSPTEAAHIYGLLAAHTQDYDDINRLLAATSSSNLFYLGMGLFHTDAEVRLATCRLLQRIENHSAGRVFFQSISLIHQLAYQRILKSTNSATNSPVSTQSQRLFHSAPGTPANLGPPSSTFVPMDGIPF